MLMVWRVPVASAQISRPAAAAKSAVGAVYASIAGKWEGTLEYRDYGNDGRVTLPTTMTAETTADGSSLTLRFRYDEGRGRVVESTESIRIDPEKSLFIEESDGGKYRGEFRLSGLDSFAAKATGTLLLSGTGEENGRKVEVKKTLEIKTDGFSLLKETRLPDKPFLFRNQYTFKRAEAKKR
jgi:hypothetical protein